MRFSLLAALACAIGAVSNHPTTAQTPAADSLTNALTEQYHNSVMPGFSVAIVTRDSVWYQHGFGFADIKQQRPYTPQTLQNVGSVSKTLVGVALLRAVEQGLFTLDTPINELLPFPVINPHQPKAVITVRHLATHTSGIVDRPRAYQQSYRFGARAQAAAPPLADFLRDYFTPSGRLYQPDNFQPTAPGAAYAYSNVATALAAYLIEARSRQPFADYTRQQLFAPLGLRQSGWQYDATQADRYATNYKTRRRAYRPYSLVTYPDGGLRTSCAELSRYLRAVLSGYAGTPSPLLRAASFQELLRPQFAAAHLPAGVPPKEPNSGIFWAVRANGQLGHTGSDPGTTVFMFFSPQTGIGKILMANVDTNEHTTPQIVALWRTLEAYEMRISGLR